MRGVLRFGVGAVLGFEALLSSGQTPPIAEFVCDVQVSHVRERLVVKPNPDVYAVSKVEINGNFRFAAQYLPLLNLFKTYTYDHSKGRFVLLAEQEFTPTADNCAKTLGVHRGYGSPNEREFSFQCQVVCSP